LTPDDNTFTCGTDVVVPPVPPVYHPSAACLSALTPTFSGTVNASSLDTSCLPAGKTDPLDACFLAIAAGDGSGAFGCIADTLSPCAAPFKDFCKKNNAMYCSLTEGGKSIPAGCIPSACAGTIDDQVTATRFMFGGDPAAFPLMEALLGDFNVTCSASSAFTALSVALMALIGYLW